MKFLQQIQDSIYNPAFYAKVPKQTFGTALKYFLLLMLLISLIRTIDTLPALIDVQRKAPEWVASVVNYFPEELEIKIKDGQTSTNANEPYFIPLNPDNEATSSGQNLLVIDTKTPFSASQFNQYNTIAWLTKDSLFYKDGEGQDLRGYQLSEIDDLTINRSLAQQTTKYLEPWYNLITYLLFVAVLLGLTFVNILNLLYLLVLAALIWLMAKIFKWGLEYSQAYKVGMYAITLSLLVDTLLTLTHRWTNISGFNLMFSLIALAVVYLNLSKTKRASS